MKGVAAAALCMLCTSAARAEPVMLEGSGSTFVYPIMSRWIEAAKARFPDVVIEYRPLGSGRGVKDITERVTDFGATDGPMTGEELARAPGMLHLPVTLGAVVPIYNLPGIAGLKLAPDVLARIFLGRITQWRDPQIARDNPGVKLPDLQISVAHRADGSGTTAIFTDYLAKVSPEWRSGPGAGKAVQWPVGAGGKGNEGVSGLVAMSEGWIGYVELTYALSGKFGIAQVRNHDGAFVSASSETIAAAAAGQVPDDFRVSITNAPGPSAWPMAGFSWVLARRQQADPQKARALLEFLSWCIHEGQEGFAAAGYAPLPRTLVPRIEAALRTIAVDGQPTPAQVGARQ